MKQELSTNGSYTAQATVVIAAFSVIAKILGLARDALFSNRFGTSEVVDAYFAAFRIPDFIFNLLILGTFSVAFIPVFSEYVLKDKKEADRMASSILNFTFILILVLSGLSFIFLKPLVGLITPGFSLSQMALTERFTAIFLLSPIFLTLSSIISSILNSHKKFAVVAFTPVIYNLSIIFGVVVLYPDIGNIGLALGVVIGAFLHFTVQLPQLYSLGYRHVFAIDFNHPGFKKFWFLYWPRIFSMGSGQISLLIATFFGSFLASGSLSAFYYANNLQSVFLSVFAISAALAVFPLLSDLYNQKNETLFKEVIAKTTVQILYFIIPLSVLMLVLRAQIVRLILGIGQNTNFSFADTRVVSLSLGLFVISMFAQGLIPLYNRAFYARQKTLAPVVISFLTIIVGIVFNYLFVDKFGIPGLALAYSVASLLNLLFLLAHLHRTIGSINDSYVIINTFKIGLASVLTGLASYAMLYAIAPAVNMQTYLGIFIQAASSGIVAMFVYLLAGNILGIKEAKNIIRLIRLMLSKSVRPFVIISNMWS